MSGFAADWLALRESADLRARNADVRAAATALFADHRSLTIVDLGCGTGANLRALARHLPAEQRWRLVDNDPTLLAAARAALARWAECRQEQPGRLVLHKSGKRIEIVFERADLARSFADVLAGPAELVTAAAFFDLTSPAWIESFCGALKRRTLPLYAALTCNGSQSWSPPHPADTAIRAAFRAHQKRDKGFGPAAGVAAAAGLRAELQHEGYDVISGASSWRLGTGDRALMAALADGTAAAVAETGRLPAADCAAWRAARQTARTCIVGHIDLFGRPRRIAEERADEICSSHTAPMSGVRSRPDGLAGIAGRRGIWDGDAVRGGSTRASGHGSQRNSRNSHGQENQ